EEVKRTLAAGKISEGHGRALKALDGAQAQNAALHTVIAKDLNVRQTEELVRMLKGHKPPKAQKATPSADTQALQAQLRDALGTKVSLQPGANGGRITLFYYSEEELDTLVE